MKISLGFAVTLQTRYLQKRGSIFQFVMRVPSDLVKRYGQKFVRLSLKTSDEREAIRKAEILAKKHISQFKALQVNPQLQPVDVMMTVKELAETWESYEQFIEFKVDVERDKYCRSDVELYETAKLEDYLSPVDIAVGQLLKEGLDVVRLSDAINLYWNNHRKSKDSAFVERVERDWRKLIEVVGDIPVMSLTRAQARQFVDHSLATGLKTASVRRLLNHLNAVLNVAIRESELTKSNPFTHLQIAGEGKDSRTPKVPSQKELHEIAKKFYANRSSTTSLLILLQMELGTRIGEVSGLSVDDVFLNHDVPHVYFRNHPWRTLKNDESERRIPVVGLGLDALRIAMKLPREGKGLFEQYAKVRGNDSASAAVNKRLQPWGITSHCFRHAMKDRLREVGCTKDIRDAIQGHTSGNVADNYGQGHTLKTMQQWLLKVALPVDA